MAEKVRLRIGERVASLSQLPRQGRRISADVRVLPVTDVQYVVTYSVTEALIIILRVHHTRENRDAS
jgi:plasmid stabilization system protein ParE